MTIASQMSWTRTEHFDTTITWERSDGNATVMALKVEGGWRVEIWEGGQWIGSEPISPYRSGAVVVAKKWLKALSRPTE